MRHPKRFLSHQITLKKLKNIQIYNPDRMYLKWDSEVFGQILMIYYQTKKRKITRNIRNHILFFPNKQKDI